MKLGKPTKIKLDCGEILRIDATGNVTRSQFDDSKLFLATPTGLGTTVVLPFGNLPPIPRPATSRT
jgi:hypothetical protein